MGKLLYEVCFFERTPAKEVVGIGLIYGGHFNEAGRFGKGVPFLPAADIGGLDAKQSGGLALSQSSGNAKCFQVVAQRVHVRHRLKVSAQKKVKNSVRNS